jgi:hypothetical protein
MFSEIHLETFGLDFPHPIFLDRGQHSVPVQEQGEVNLEISFDTLFNI